jgi:hypothetical protein
LPSLVRSCDRAERAELKRHFETASALLRTGKQSRGRSASRSFEPATMLLIASGSTRARGVRGAGVAGDAHDLSINAAR